MFTAHLLVALWLAPAQASKPAFDPSWVLEVSTPTYGPDGSTTGATAGMGALTAQPLVFYPTSGRSLCASSSATRDVPSDAGYGWRVTVTPLANAGGRLKMRVAWERMWEAGAKVTKGPHGESDVTVGPGDHIPFDYIPAAAGDAASQKCDAIGMGLEIGLKPIPSNALVEANLWLVRTQADGTEVSQHQTLRVRPGTSAEYFFDDVGSGAAPVRENRTYYFNSALRTQGKLSAIRVEGGKVQLDLEIAQFVASPTNPSNQTNGGSTTFRVNAAPSEVLSFNVPKISGERLALRIQVKQLR